MAKIEKKRILFLSEKSLLDVNSGAAIEVKTWLETLVKRGHECMAFNFTCFDGRDQYDVKRHVSPQIDVEADHGKIRILNQNGVAHHLLVTRSSDTMKLVGPDFQAYSMAARKRIDTFKPDYILCFGSHYLAPILQHGKVNGAKTMFYLATGTYQEKTMPTFKACDEILVPSAELSKFYKETLGLKTTVIPTFPNHPLVRKAEELPELARTRRDRFVTMINPAAPKGALVFINLANMYQKVDPDITFLAVESRGKRKDWDSAGLNLGNIKNLWWIPQQQRIETVFRKTSVLIVPSLAYEAAGKVIAEALLCGIPVIAANTGGIPEQMRGSGFVIDVPDDMREKYNSVTGAYTEQWIAPLKTLLDDEEAYLQAAKAALKAGAAYKPDRIARQLFKLFEG